MNGIKVFTKQRMFDRLYAEDINLEDYIFYGVQIGSPDIILGTDYNWIYLKASGDRGFTYYSIYNNPLTTAIEAANKKGYEVFAYKK